MIFSHFETVSDLSYLYESICFNSFPFTLFFNCNIFDFGFLVYQELLI